jgi:hypothetical protein
MSEFQELEYKYKADNVKLTDFQNLGESLNPTKKLDVSSWDVYYTKEGTEDIFQRYRESTNPELTKKRKTVDTNNWERIEVDLPLDSARVNEKIVETFVALDGYKKNFKIYKSCFIFWFDKTNMVYYTVYDENMKEIGRYIEVEVNKDRIEVAGKENCLSELATLEIELEKLGISKKNRMKRSLFEIYRN